MTAPTPETASTNPINRQTVCDYGNFIVAALFIFMGVGSLVDREWIDGAGWLTLALGLVPLIGSTPVSGETWSRPRCLTSLFLMVVGISLLLNAPGHHRDHLKSSAVNSTTAPASTTNPR